MQKELLYRRGDQLIGDAQFVRNMVLPCAVTASRWNIVVFECYRAAELLIKGIVLSFGVKPLRSHELDRVMDAFIQHVAEQRTQVPFLYRLTDPNGNRYELRLNGQLLELLKVVHGTWQVMTEQHVPLMNGPLYLIRRGHEVSLVQNGTPVMVMTDATLRDDVKYERGIPVWLPSSRLAAAFEILRELRCRREQAFYQEAQFTRRAAVEQIDRLDRIFGLARAFVCLNRLRHSTTGLDCDLRGLFSILGNAFHWLP